MQVVGISDIAACLDEVLEPKDVAVTGVPATVGVIRPDATQLAHAGPAHTLGLVVRR